jgi:cysteinyl-tRNA synthetase
MRLYSTLQRGPVELPPPPGPVRMYVCGPTVYARAHVGNARPFVVAMWLRGWLRERGYEVVLVHNITDVDDKILAAPGPSAEVAAQAAQWYLEDVGSLGLGLPDALPRATQTIPSIKSFIAQLVERGAAYPVGGDVYFRVERDPEYGRLSGQRPDEVAEQEPNPLKEDPRDFALWKGTKPGEDLAWDSPWGRGRPGWHIECSVMAEELLGPVFEIHGGGLDLVFPHHENELAQSRALGHEFARIWMHNGMLRFVGEKMSKSVGNVLTIREALEEWGRETLLLFFMRGHWRKPIDFSEPALFGAEIEKRNLQNAFRRFGYEKLAELPAAAVEVLDEDFNTPDLLALIHEWANHGRMDFVYTCLEPFGLGSLATQQEAPPELHALARRRLEARRRRDFAEADAMRAEIEAAGWEARDIPDEPGYELVPR